LPAGALYVPGAERLLPAISKLNHYAVAHAIPLISTADAHTENDPEFRQWPPHCVAGTTGQLKPAETLVGEGQTVVEKQVLDVFSNPDFRPLLDRLQADQYVVYGVATDYCVRCALTGLLATGKPVTLVTDAIAAVNPEDGARAIAEFTARGGTLATVQEVTP
jgi:nicotinamidase/pyrazinamidase